MPPDPPHPPPGGRGGGGPPPRTPPPRHPAAGGEAALPPGTPHGPFHPATPPPTSQPGGRGRGGPPPGTPPPRHPAAPPPCHPAAGVKAPSRCATRRNSGRSRKFSDDTNLADGRSRVYFDGLALRRSPKIWAAPESSLYSTLGNCKSGDQFDGLALRRSRFWMELIGACTQVCRTFVV